VKSACKPFVCDGDACATSCATDADCAHEYHCDGGACRGGDRCDGDHTIARADETVEDCAPYGCTPEGTCRTTCTSALDCPAGRAGSGGEAEGSCPAPRPSGPDAAGCDCVVDARRGPSGAGALGAAVALLGAAARRLRRRRGGTTPLWVACGAPRASAETCL